MTNKTAIPYGFRCPGRFAIGNILKNLQQIHVQYIHHKWKITINGDLTTRKMVILWLTLVNNEMIMGFTLWLFNIAMENDPFIDDVPIKNDDFP